VGEGRKQTILAGKSNVKNSLEGPGIENQKACSSAKDLKCKFMAIGLESFT
jgi:hypothetical protein